MEPVGWLLIGGVASICVITVLAVLVCAQRGVISDLEKANEILKRSINKGA